MKLKSVLAAAAAAAALMCTSVCAFAETASDETPNDSAEVVSATEAEDPIDKSNPNSGVEGVAAVVGVAMVAGAALVVSHRHDR